jgi:hypothetical protein
MNRDWVKFHLGEAREAIEQTLLELEADPEYDDSEFWVSMQHLYHHINTAWNARNASAGEVEPVKEADFNQWSRFPTDLPMLGNW